MTALGVSLGLWQDRPAQEVLETAVVADELGYSSLWIGEMATYDAFALATAVGARTERIELTIGPLAVTVRDPMMIAMGVASVAALTGRPVQIALGTSSSVVVEGWHGRSRARSAQALAESAQAVRALLDGQKAAFDGEVVSTKGYRLRLTAPHSEITIAAFGHGAIRAAAAYADRMVLNLVDVQTTKDLITQLDEESAALGRPRPRVAVWACAAVDGGPAAYQQLRSGILGYLAAPGYGEMFARAGFGELVTYARTRPHPRDLLARIPHALIDAVSLIGDIDATTTRIAQYAAAGADEIIVVPSCTDRDPAGRTTLSALSGFLNAHTFVVKSL